MQSIHSKRSRPSWVVFAVVWAVLAVAAGGGASAAPVETVLHSFMGGNSDGANPKARLIADTSGNLYGTTEFGGAFGEGTVFKLSPSGTVTVLHSFCSLPGCRDGDGPVTGLIFDSSGNLYGTTSTVVESNDGVVFKLSPGGTETVLQSFTGSGDGVYPSGLISDSGGNLYGTTGEGGSGCYIPFPPFPSGCGVVFKLSPGGTETVLYSFCPFFPNCSDGAGPGGGLIADSSGNLYGLAGGGTLGKGVVFKLTPGGTETVLYSFKGGP